MSVELELKKLVKRLDLLQSSLEQLERKVGEIMATQQELVTTLNNVTAELQKVATETTTLLKKIDELNAVIVNGPAVTAELQAAVDAVAAQAKVVDDLVPDAPPAPVKP